MQRYMIMSRPDENSRRLEEKTHKILAENHYILDKENPEVIFVIGGDGTFLYAVHQYVQKLQNIKFYGIHTGTLGFYTDYQEADYDEFMDTFLRGAYMEISSPLLCVHVGDNTYHALNEARIENVTRTQTMNVWLDDVFLEVFRGTGLCVSTQLGSTAYNRSLGGAVIQEGTNIIQLTEIAGIHHSQYRSLGSPLVMNENVTVHLQSTDFRGAKLGVDSDIYPIDDLHEIIIRKDPEHQVKMLKGRKVSYFTRLKTLF